MKRFLSLFLIFLMLFSAAACTAKKDEPAPKDTKAAPAAAPTEQGGEKTYTPAEIEAAIAAALGDGYNATVDVPKDEMYSCALKNVDLSKLDSYVARITRVPSMQQDMVVIATAKDADYAKTLVDLFNKEYEYQIMYTGKYPMEPHKLSQTRIFRVGNTVMYITAGRSAEDKDDDTARIALADAEYKKIEEALRGLYGFVPENLRVEPEEEEGQGEEIGAQNLGVYDGEEMPIDEEPSGNGAPVVIYEGAEVN